eukprot:gnl/Spiro4/15693_TR8438_c0_g1_i1.p1 gnl/Spiro4/15693_TR8438_c0_g1~~gnl/Spiro4/15693_TR8438_c0_g1_i1.p1  ORF type:complete len:1031 (+),score=286.05 gnl/Spiro4/15693_TR8438_c0_g1_i1:63-3155(+)
MPRVSKAQLVVFERLVSDAIEFAKRDASVANNLRLIELCESIEMIDVGPQCALSALEGHVKNHKDTRQVLAALSVLDNCVKFCDYRFHKQLATTKWMERLIKIVENPKGFLDVKEKILQLLADWREDHQNEPGLVAFQRAAVSLTQKGHVLPCPTDPVMRAPDPEIYMSIRRSTRRGGGGGAPRQALPDDWKAQLESVESHPPPPTQHEPPSMLSHLIPEMDDLYMYMGLLGEFITNSVHNQKAQTAADACRTWLRRIQALLSSEASEDVIVELLEINYELLRLLELWDIMDTSVESQHYDAPTDRRESTVSQLGPAPPLTQENLNQAISNENYWREKYQAVEREKEQLKNELRSAMKGEAMRGGAPPAGANLAAGPAAAKIAELEAELAKTQDRLKRHTKRESKFKVELQEERTQKELLEARVKDLQFLTEAHPESGEAVDFMARLNEIRETERELREQLANEVALREQVEQSLIAAEERAQLMERQSNDTRQAMDLVSSGDSDAALRDMQSQLAAEQMAASELRTSKAQLESTVASLETQMAVLRKEHSRLSTAEESATTRYSELASKVADLEGRNAEQQRRMATSVGAYASQVRSFDQRLQLIKKDNHDVRHSIKSMTRKLADECSTIEGTLMSTVSAFISRYANLETENQELMKKYKSELNQRKRLYNAIQELKGKIRVFCRCRPMSANELRDGHHDVTSYGTEGSDEISITNPQNDRKTTFEFDHVFHPGNSTQASIFENVEPLVTSILDGYNVCIFAYGQTGSGKTYTMEGPPEDPGINYRTLQNLFDLSSQRAPDFQYELTMSILEIYNEQIRDLLSHTGDRLDIRHVGNSVEVAGLTSRPVFSLDEVLRVMEEGQSNRSTGRTNMNEHSSRSHCVTSIYATGTNTPTGMKSLGKLHLIDLAGSERVGKSEATGDRLKEAQFINQSLSALGDVMSALSQKDRSHIPFRNSKLTHLLQDSLGGSAKTLMFVNISPASYNTVETLCSLNFACHVRTVELGQAKKNTGASEGGGAPSAPSGRGKKR